MLLLLLFFVYICYFGENFHGGSLLDVYMYYKLTHYTYRQTGIQTDIYK